MSGKVNEYDEANPIERCDKHDVNRKKKDRTRKIANFNTSVDIPQLGGMIH
jgi:hypothetical protein